MLRRKLSESLTARIFLITLLMLLCAGAAVFGLIAWAAPNTYTAVVNEDLQRQVDALTARLSNTKLADCGPLLDEFIRSSGADVMLEGPDGKIPDTGSQLAVQAVYEDRPLAVTGSGKEAAAQGDLAVTWASDTDEEDIAVTVTMSEQDTITAEVKFTDEAGPYFLYITPRMKAENLAVRALAQMAPWLLAALLLFSLLCALVYSRYITQPIVRLSKIAVHMAQLDFHWECRVQRRDEIGDLSRSLEQMAQRLSAALRELKTANDALRGEVERERERERQQTAFFSAASHELKTPVTILKGQLSGMLEGVDIYRDRDKYLLRSLQVTGRMENLIREMLAISHMEAGADAAGGETVELSALIERQVSLDSELMKQRGQSLTSRLTPGITVTGDISLLGRAVGNLVSNASLYSPPGAQIRVWCGRMDGRPALTVENTGAHIREDALPHLFEAFYREDGSRNRSAGGSGLGLYLVQKIAKRHRASCAIENTAEGVRATVVFPESPTVPPRSEETGMDFAAEL